MRNHAKLLMWLLLTPTATVLAQPVDELQAWLTDHVVTVRSINPADEDFSDLEPLVDAIGTARVVQLGEPSHGAGASFSAKVRLIKFLHQRMGFDVVAWESGMYGLRLTQAGLRSSEDAVTAAQRGILKIWSGADEVRPLFEYAKATQATIRPIDMAGFDMQISAEKSSERFAADLRSFVHALRDAGPRDQASEAAERALTAFDRIHAHIDAEVRQRSEASKVGQSGNTLQETIAEWEKREGHKLRPKQEDLEHLDATIDELMTLIDKHRAGFEQVHGANEIEFMTRAIENTRAYGANVFGFRRADRPTGEAARMLRSEQWNRRDTLMANNLRWLMEDVYRGRKIVVWAHNAHVMEAYFAEDWRGVHHAPQPNGMKPSGTSLAEWLGDELYTIALTTYEGEDRWATADNTTTIAPATAGSMESHLHKLGSPYVFLDLRSLGRDPRHPLRAPVSMRISGYGAPTSQYGNDLVPDITKAFDAVFYIDRMTPATRVTVQSMTKQ